MRKQPIVPIGLVLVLMLAVALGRGLTLAQPVVGGRGPSLSGGSTIATRIALPALDVGDGWETTIRVQNAGDAHTRAVLDLYPAYDGQCPAESSVVGTLCSGLIAPGTAWVWDTFDLPASARSAIVYSVVPGTEDTVCGGDGTRQPGPPIAVTVDRLREETDVIPAAASAYTGIPQERAGTFDPTVNGFVYFVPSVAVEDQGQITSLIVQNLGDECASFELSYQPQDDCSQVTTDEVLALAPGEAVRVNPGDVLTSPFRGSAWIRATQPLAVVVDQWAGEGSVLMTSQGVAQDLGSLVNHVPLVYRDFEGWNASLNVQNTSSTTDAKAKAYFMDSSDDIITTIVSWICPRGTRSYHLSEINDLPGHYVGPARIESQEWWTPNDPSVFITNIVSSVDLVNEEAGQGVSYTGVTVPEGEEIELVALPSLMKDETRSSRIAIYNPGPGSAGLQFEVYDQNGLLDVLGLPAGHTYMDLASWGSINPGFRGSGLVRVTSQGGGSGLGVVVMEHNDGSAGGDWSRGYAGIPIWAAEASPTPMPTATATPTSTPTVPPTVMPEPTATPTPPVSPTPVEDAGIWTTFANGDDVQALLVEGDTVWAGTRAGGLVRWNTADGTYVQILHPQDDLACNDVRDIAVDAAGNKWLATCRGLSVLSAKGVISTTYTTANSGLPNDDVTAVAVDSEGTVWLGTTGREVASFDGQEWTTYTHDPEIPGAGPADGEIFSLIVDDADRVWVAPGMLGYGVSVYDGVIWTHYTTQNSCLASNRVIAMAPGMGGVWLGTQGGGATFIGDCGCATYGAADGLGSNYVMAIAVGQDGRAWFGLGGSGGAVCVLDGASTPCDRGDDHWTCHDVEGSIRALATEPSGAVWIGTISGCSLTLRTCKGGGLSRFDGDTWTTYSTASAGLVSNWVTAI
ncbi:MAG TPA: hypothetical protein EYP55_03550, partial [Anaerolineae bacterium]|nr:hypothetical protein [Anaerolineae bacterium]